jgi:hypothetical protein
MKNHNKLAAMRVQGKSVMVRGAVLFDRDGIIHSVMVSNNSMWSAAQRVKASKGKLFAERVQIQVSVPAVQRMILELIKPKKLVEVRETLADDYEID